MATNRELTNAAWNEILKSTISGVEWQKRVTDGYKGKPYNWQATAFGRAKALLDGITDAPTPTPAPSPTPAPAPVPAPSDPLATSVGTASEILFPRNPGAIGTDLPGRPGAGLLDFADLDYEGWSTGNVNGRLKYVLDPAGSGRKVIRWELRYGDDADHWGGQRIELFPYPFDQTEGKSAWFAWSWYLPVDFKFPSGWCLFFQNFSQPDGSPPQALELNGTSKEWVWDARKTRYDEAGRKAFAPATLGVWHHFLLYTLFSEGAAGRQRLWHSVGSFPDHTKPPVDSRNQNTLYQGLGHPALLMYRQPKASSEYPMVAYSGPFVRTTTPDRARQLIAPPPPPPTGLVVAPPVGSFTVLDGNFAAAAHPSAFVRTAAATTIKKLNVKRYTGYGIGAMQYYPPSVQQPGRTIVEDCIAEEITSNPPGIMDGTGESGFWFGNPTDAKRLIARNCGWMGMWTGSKASGSVIEDFEIEQTRGVGLYVEHITSNSVFRRFKIKSGGNGINIEWWYGGEGSSNLLFEDGDIYCANPSNLDYRTAGVFADAGTFGCTFRRIRFWGPGNAIGLPNKLVDPSKPNVVQDCVFENLGRRIYYHDNAIG